MRCSPGWSRFLKQGPSESRGRAAAATTGKPQRGDSHRAPSSPRIVRSDSAHETSGVTDSAPAPAQRTTAERIGAELPWLLRRCRRTLTNSDQSDRSAHDLSQEAVLRALASDPEFSNRTQAQLRAWLFVIARNLLRNGYRRMALPNLSAMDEVHIESPDQPRLSKLTEPHLQVARRRMSNDEEACLMLRSFCSLPMETIASILGRSPQAVAMLHSRVLGKLRSSAR